MAITNKVRFGNYTFILEQDLPHIGWYIYVYDGKKCIYDNLQDNRDIAIDVLFQEFNCPRDLWV